MNKFFKHAAPVLCAVLLACLTGCGKKDKPVPVTLETIEITAPVTKSEYLIGEELNTEGLEVTAIYTDGSTEIVTSLCEFNGFDSSAVAQDLEVTVSYTEDDVTKSAVFTVTIKEAAADPQDPQDPQDPDNPNNPDTPPVPPVKYVVIYVTEHAQAPEDKTVETGYKLTQADLPALTAQGYVFGGWDKAVDFEITANTTITANWTAATNTPYKVEHYQQKVNNNEYTLVSDDTENKTGTTDTLTQAVAKSYQGFEARDFSQVNIAADGSSVVKIYYNRLAGITASIVFEKKDIAVTAKTEDRLVKITPSAGFTDYTWTVNGQTSAEYFSVDEATGVLTFDKDKASENGAYFYTLSAKKNGLKFYTAFSQDYADIQVHDPSASFPVFGNFFVTVTAENIRKTNHMDDVENHYTVYMTLYKDNVVMEDYEKMYVDCNNCDDDDKVKIEINSEDFNDYLEVGSYKLVLNAYTEYSEIKKLFSYETNIQVIENECAVVNGEIENLEPGCEDLVDFGMAANSSYIVTSSNTGLKLEIGGKGLLVDEMIYPWQVTNIPITECYISDGIWNIPIGFLSDMLSLEKVTGCKDVKIIDATAFSNCSSLTTLPDFNNVVIIASEAFHNCTSLVNITGFEKIIGIYDSAFGACTALESIPASFNGAYVESDAFMDAGVSPVSGN